MDDNRIIELLVKKAAAQINAAESEELDSLLVQHPDATYYETFVAELWKTPKRKSGSNDMFEKHLKRHTTKISFASPKMYHKSGRRLIFRTRVLVAAAVIVVALIGYLFFNMHRIAGNHKEPIEYVAAKGVKKQIILPDGTRAWLNSGSRLSYSANFGKEKTRAVHLEGEAYFDVTEDENRPFTISTDKITIKVLGTSFNVKAYPEESKTETTLISGEIELFVNERPKEKIIMKPNEKVEVTSSRPADGHATIKNNQPTTVTIGSLSKIRVADKEYIQEASWVENRLIFKDEPLHELIPKLERWYNVNIVLENGELGDYKYTGSITRESLVQTLNALQLINSFNYKIAYDDITIY